MLLFLYTEGLKINAFIKLGWYYIYMSDQLLLEEFEYGEGEEEELLINYFM